MKKFTFRYEGGNLIIRGPAAMTKGEAAAFAEGHRDLWEPLLRPRAYENDLEREKVFLFGEPLGTIPWDGPLRRDGKCLFIPPKGVDPEELKTIYREALEEFLEEIKEECQLLTGTKEEVLSFYQYKSRFGTCFPERKEIRLAYDLARRSKEEVRFVYLHELTHLKHPNHSKAFYRDLRKVVKEYDVIIEKLKE